MSLLTLATFARAGTGITTADSQSSRERNSVAHALPQSIRLPLQDAVLAATPSA